MSRNNDLPFERGNTYCEGDSTMIAALGSEYEGREYEDVDPVTGRAQILKVLKNGHSTVVAGGRGVAPLADYPGRRTADYVASAGGLGYLVDPYYVTTGVSIAVGDLFYAVIGGFISNARLGASNAVENGAMCFDTAGYLIPVSTNDPAHIVGLAAEDVTSTGQGNENVDLNAGYEAAAYDRT